MIDHIVGDFVSRDALGPLLNMFVSPDPRDELFTIEGPSPCLSDFSLDVFSSLDTEKHVQIAYLSSQKAHDLGSPILDEYPEDKEHPPTSFLVDLGNDQPVYDYYEVELDIDSRDSIDSLISGVL